MFKHLRNFIAPSFDNTTYFPLLIQDRIQDYSYCVLFRKNPLPETSLPAQTPAVVTVHNVPHNCWSQKLRWAEKKRESKDDMWCEDTKKNATYRCQPLPPSPSPSFRSPSPCLPAEKVTKCHWRSYHHLQWLLGPRWVRDGMDSSGTCENTVVHVTVTRRRTDAWTLRIHRHRGGKISYLRVKMVTAVKQHI